MSFQSFDGRINMGEFYLSCGFGLRASELERDRISSLNPDRLFTPRFFIMCAYSFTVFVSVFQLLPTAPYHILDLGGTTVAAGLFLGFLTYSSALSAPITGT